MKLISYITTPRDQKAVSERPAREHFFVEHERTIAVRIPGNLSDRPFLRFAHDETEAHNFNLNDLDLSTHLSTTSILCQPMPGIQTEWS
jgi:hypothetical protein